jgi:YHS domain-containing protein
LRPDRDGVFGLSLIRLTKPTDKSDLIGGLDSPIIRSNKNSNLTRQAMVVGERGNQRLQVRRKSLMKRGLFALCSLVLAVAVVGAEEAAKFTEKCVVSGAPAKMDKFAEYKGGKVYFCCENCPKAFAKDTAKFATKANEQLVSTGQAKQEKCPLSGGKLNPDAKVKVDGIEVGFCCNMCKGKVEKAEGDAQRELVFSDEAFAKGFVVPKK